MPAYRYRMKLPGEYLKSIGNSYEITDLPIEADLHIYCKPYHQNEELLEATMQLASKRRIILDICDDVFKRTGPVPQYMRNMAKMAEAITVSTEYLQQTVMNETGCEAVVISDPCEFPQKQIKDISEPKIMWFGTFTNIIALRDMDLNYPLEILCSRKGYKAAKEIGAKFTEWSMEAMHDAFDRNNIVIIPSLDKYLQQAKSPNRVFESIRSGLSVVAAPLESYKQFDITLDWDMNNGLKSIKQTTPELQKYVDDNFNISVIGEQWNQLFQKTIYGSTLDAEQKSLKTG